MNRSLYLLGLLAMAGLSSTPALGAKLPQFSTNGIRPVSNFFLCQSSHSGKTQAYSCRDYRQGDQRFRAYYRGGTAPKAVATLDTRGRITGLQVAEQANDKPTAFPVRPPRGVPATAKFQGSGVCLNDNDKNVPCGIFVDKSARVPVIARYMVFYDAKGSGVTTFDREEAGPNRDAIPAELAYQIGVRLMASDCCRVEGLRYLKAALSLFPDSMVYRKTYERYRVELAASPSNPGA
jgi:hypothetical protein